MATKATKKKGKTYKAKKEQTVTVTMNLRQTYILNAALDLYSRLYIGQFDRLDNVLMDNSGKMSFDERLDRRKVMEHLCDAMKLLIFPELQTNSSWGVGKFDNADIAFDLLKVIRHTLEWKDGEPERYTVDKDNPMKFGTEPLATCEITDSKEQVKNLHKLLAYNIGGKKEQDK
jgi:hypothetical protein